MMTKPATRLIDRLTRRLEIPADPDAALRTLLETEWIVTNGLGGYASTSVAGVITRRYHGLLVAALPNPLGRMVMLNHLGARIVCDGRSTPLNGAATVAGPLDRASADRVREMRLDAGLPVWLIECGNARVEKRIQMPHGQNSVHVTHTMIEGPDRVTLELTPAVHFRGYEDRVDTPRNAPANTRYVMTSSGGLHVLSAAGAQDLPPLRLTVVGGDWRFLSDERVTDEFIYPVEESRGYEFRGTLFTPGHFEIALERNRPVTLIASTERDEVMLALTPEELQQCEHDRRRRLIGSAVPAAQDDTGGELVLAADQFIITPAGRVADATRATAM